jgi:hypothetical protein
MPALRRSLTLKNTSSLESGVVEKASSSSVALDYGSELREFLLDAMRNLLPGKSLTAAAAVDSDSDGAQRRSGTATCEE